MKIYEVLGKSAERWPDTVAIRDRHGDIEYQTLQSEVIALRIQLQQLGIESGQGIGVKAQNGREFVIAVFALLGCGATVLPIFHQTCPAELEVLISTAGLHGIIEEVGADRSLYEPQNVLEISSGDALCFSRTKRARDEVCIDFVPDAAFVRFTSGTTGSSKGVILSNTGVLERTTAANKGLRLSHEDAVLWVLPMAFHFLVSIVLYVEVGATIIVAQDHLASTLLHLANLHSATLLYASPMHFRLLAADKSGALFTTLKRAISTSTSIPLQVSQTFFKRYSLPVTQAYGIIEVGLPLINLEKAEACPESVGKQFSEQETAILDKNCIPLPPGETGQLAFRGPGLFSGYLSPPQPVAEILQNGWFLSGDEAVEHKDGSITVVGRIKSMINVSGNKVFPEEVESVINRHVQVETSRVSAKAHPLMGEVVQAEIVLKNKSEGFDAEELITFCRQLLSSYKVPQFVKIVPFIDETMSGKIKRGRV